MVSDESLTEHVRQLRAAREMKRQAESMEEAEESAIKGRLGEFAVLVGSDFRITWKRSKDSERVAWEDVARGAGATPELIALHTSFVSGSRRFVLGTAKDD
jgi:hypothetical protein